jgi:hypothetical protein
MRGSAATDSSKVLAVRLMTSESASAKTNEAKARSEAEVVREHKRMVETGKGKGQ